MGDARVVHEDVDMVELLDDLGNALLHLAIVAYVAMHAIHALVIGVDLFHGIVFDIEDDDLCAFLHELLGHATAQAIGTTGHQRDLVDESLLFHGCILSILLLVSRCQV